MTNIVDIPIHMWDKCLAYIDRFLTEASRLLTRTRGVGRVLYMSQVKDLDDAVTFISRFVVFVFHGR